jgi:hypothetical protein
MSKVSLLNIIIGFVVIFVSASAGSFIVQDLTDGFLKDPSILTSWQTTILTSAHGHTNLFGMLHILMGLTFPYSVMSRFIKTLQTFGLFLGTLAMGPGMMLNAARGPSEMITLTTVLIGLGLSLALISIAIHCLGLLMKYKNAA